MKKFVVTSVLASSILFPATAGAENLSFPTKVTVEKKVEIHTGATNAYPVIATLNAGLQVNVTKEFTNSAGEMWVLVDLGNAKGWANSALLTAQDCIILNGYAKVTGASVVSRKGPSDSYSAAGTLANSVTVKVIDSFETGSGEEWYRVVSGKQFGWVKGKYLTPVHSSASPFTAVQKTVYSKNTVVRSGASTAYSVVGMLVKNQKVIVFDSVKNASNEVWDRVQSGKITGWVLSTAFGPSQGSTSVGQSPQVPVTEPVVQPQPQPGTGSQSGPGSQPKPGPGPVSQPAPNPQPKQGPVSQPPGTVLQGFVSPSAYTDGKANYLVWKKSSNFNFSYSTTSNQLILKQGIAGVELPSFHVPGIQSVAASGTSSKNVTLTFAPGYTFTLRNYSDHVSVRALPTGLAGKRIIVDAGHGGKDTGAIGPHGLYEKDVTLATALLLKTELEKAGAIVTLTRGTDIFLELSQRTAISNSSNADAFISIHCDSYNGTSNGTTTYYNTTVNFNGPKSNLLAQNIEKNLTSSLKTYNRGVKEQDFYVNRMNTLPSVLVELAYISNPKEEALLRSSDFRQKAAIGIREGLEDYFNHF